MSKPIREMTMKEYIHTPRSMIIGSLVEEKLPEILECLRNPGDIKQIRGRYISREDSNCRCSLGHIFIAVFGCEIVRITDSSKPGFKIIVPVIIEDESFFGSNVLSWNDDMELSFSEVANRISNFAFERRGPVHYDE